MSAVERAPKQWCVAIEGWPFIGVALPVLLVGLLFNWPIVTAVTLAFVIFSLFFFRNPDRKIEAAEGAILSPADGKVISIEEVVEPHFLNIPMRKVSIFMSVANAHVNRAPLTGVVKKMAYYPGKFFCASFDKASLSNERHAVLLDTAAGEIVFIQIAGLIARRIVSYLKEGDTIRIGERYGLIRFGSRLDLYLPLKSDIKVAIGQKVKAGLDTIGFIS